MKPPGLLLLILAGTWNLRAETYSLESETVRLRLDSGNASITSLADKRTGREWLDPAAPSPLYSIEFADGSPPVPSLAARTVHVREEPGAITVECIHPQPAGLAVTCRFQREKGSPHLLATLSLRMESPRSLAEVRYPALTLKLPFSGTGADDRVLRPECDGTLWCNPAANRATRELPYPGSASLQMMAAFDPQAGLSVASRDDRGATKVFCSSSNGKSLTLAIDHLPPRVPVQAWELGYEVDLAGLRPSAGLDKITWEAAADLYRDWAKQQSWCRQTLAQRIASGDVPAWIAQPSLLLTFSLRGLLPDGQTGNRLSWLASQADGWRALAGVPVTCLIISWEKLDTWVTPDYFPPYGGEPDFTAVTKTLHERGHRTMVFLSGLHWTLRKDMAGPDRPPVRVDQQADFARRGKPWAISDTAGAPVIGGQPNEGIGEHATLCAATPLAREILLDTSLHCQKLGIDCVQVDQIVGGGMKACYHPDHPHPPGGGTWCTGALYRTFGDIRQAGRKQSPEFAFSIEEPNECYLPILDTYHARDLHQGRWPRSGAGIVGVPLFTHVYHPYCAGYGSEGCYVSDKPSQLSLYQIGMNLVCGKTPAVALWGRWLDPEKVEPKQRRLLRAHLDLWRGPAGEFLVHGERVASPELKVPLLDLALTEKDGKTRRQLSLPSVLHAVWKLADGRTGAIFACVGSQRTAFEFAGAPLALEPGEAVFRSLP